MADEQVPVLVKEEKYVFDGGAILHYVLVRGVAAPGRTEFVGMAMRPMRVNGKEQNVPLQFKIDATDLDDALMRFNAFADAEEKRVYAMLNRPQLLVPTVKRMN